MNSDLWVFGYGSLMWRPGFEFLERQPALLHGYHRSFCVYSHVHRGTPDRPGLVLGLDAGGACRGVAYRVHRNAVVDVVDYLREREQVTSVYLEVKKPVRVLGRHEHIKKTAVFYVADRTHTQFAGRIPFESQVKLIAEGVGQSGRNPDYLERTVEHLRKLGLRDIGLERLLAAVHQQRNVR